MRTLVHAYLTPCGELASKLTRWLRRSNSLLVLGSPPSAQTPSEEGGVGSAALCRVNVFRRNDAPVLTHRGPVTCARWARPRRPWLRPPLWRERYRDHKDCVWLGRQHPFDFHPLQVPIEEARGSGKHAAVKHESPELAARVSEAGRLPGPAGLPRGITDSDREDARNHHAAGYRRNRKHWRCGWRAQRRGDSWCPVCR